jgi:hypothetical protein
LGGIYFEGSWLAKNEELAAYWLRKSAEQNYAKAQFYMNHVCFLGISHQTVNILSSSVPEERATFEKGIEALEQEWIKWARLAFTNLEQLAKSGDIEAQYMLSRMCSGWKGITEDKSRAADLREKAIQNYKKAAEQGDTKAQRCLGEIYSYEPVNESEKIRWYTEAASHGDLIAQYKLGLFYMYKKDYAKAIEWLTKAAAQGHIEAQYQLGIIYDRMKWAPADADEVKAFHDDLKAVEWLKKASQGGHSDAQYDLAVCYHYIENIQDPNEALRWYSTAAEDGHAEAQGTLALMYYMGKDSKPPLVEKDYDKALTWFKKQAEQVSGAVLSHAQDTVANIYYSKKEYAQAFEWYEKAANRGVGYSQYTLGEMYYKGLGTERNLTKAAMWYKKAAESRYVLVSPMAQFHLAQMYFKGEGVVQDYVEAYKWANLAAMKDERYHSLRDTIKTEMTPDQIAEGQKKASEFSASNK